MKNPTDFPAQLMQKLLPPGRRAAICFSIDDIHPGRSSDAYEAGGDLGAGALGHIERLLDRHPGLRVTLFTTPDWREVSPRPTRRLAAAIPVIRDRMFLAPTLPEGTMRLDRHPEFVSYLKGLARTEIGLHGLHHIHPGPHIAVEFQQQPAATCAAMLQKSIKIFDAAGLPYVPGMNPPGWNLPPSLAEAMVRTGLTFVASARDTVTAIAPHSLTNMSGRKGVSLIYPQEIENGRLIHFTTNFQATNSIDRARQILDAGGLLSVKAHIVKQAFGYTALDGVDALYCNYLDVMFSELERRYGDELWWTSMGELASRWAQLRASTEGTSERKEGVLSDVDR